MGAQTFLAIGRGKNIERAFWREVANAISMHGDDGYTGTIAEKYEFVEFQQPHGARSLDVARWAMAFDDPELCQGLELAPVEVRDLVATMASIAWDKTAPAIGVALSPDEHFGHSELGDDRLFLFFGSAPV